MCMNRREFLLVAGGVAGTVAATGPAVAQEGNTSGGNTSGGGGNESGNATGGGGGGGSSVSGPIDYGIDGANGYDGPSSGTDATGQSEVTIAVGVGEGGYAFEPAAVHIDPGTTVIWEWESAGHNVHAVSGAEFESPLQSEGTFEWTAPEDFSGIVEYQCDPHVGQGMIAALAVGSDVPRAQPTGPVEPAVADSAKTLGIATLIAMVSTLGLAFFFLKYGGDYED